jgi:hypothetical protein
MNYSQSEALKWEEKETLFQDKRMCEMVKMRTRIMTSSFQGPV